MKHETFIKGARLLHGEQFSKPLAADLGVSLRTVTRWKSKETPIPEGTDRKMVELLRAKTGEIAGTVHELLFPDQR